MTRKTSAAPGAALDGALAARRPEPLADSLVPVLLQALDALAQAGNPRRASELAGRAYGALRHERPLEAERINRAMHRLERRGARKPTTPRRPTMSVSDEQLDVRSEIPARRHELIFETYDKLAAGAAFVLVNDHDPKPLYYQLAAEHPGQFSWDYLDAGPTVWRVRIGRSA